MDSENNYKTPPLSVADYKAEVVRKGWKFRELALRWGKSHTWLSRVANDPNRDQVWDDALRGLPFKDKG